MWAAQLPLLAQLAGADIKRHANVHFKRNKTAWIA
jgi:hypothetical protein